MTCHLYPYAHPFGGDNRLTAAVRRSERPNPNWNRHFDCRLGPLKTPRHDQGRASIGIMSSDVSQILDINPSA